MILEGDLLGAKVFLDGDRQVGATFDRGIVGDEQHLTARDPANPGDQTGARRFVIVHAERR
jgi:hypothetical protein